MGGFFYDIIPANARRYVYAVVALLSLAVSAWQASDGRWDVAAAAFLTALVGGLAHGNVDLGKPQDGNTQDEA